MALNYGGLDENGPNPMAFAGVQAPGPEGGAVSPQFATPSMAQGGAIPDDDEDDALGSNAGVDDTTTTDLNSALQAVQQALMFGRQKHGLPGGGGSSDNSEPAPQEQSGIPEDGGEESYAEGGSIEDDIQASNNATDDGPQYGRPEVVDDPDAVRPPISSNNTDYSQVPEQTAIGPAGDESGAGPATSPINDDSGAGPVASGGAQQQGGIPEEGNAPNMQRVMSYLQGKDAMPNDQALAIEQSVVREAKNDPAAVPVLATAKAGEMDGPAAAFAYIQRNRQAYDAAMGHARAAATGIQGKPADLNAAAESATRANAYLPDGVNVKFMAGPGGITARVAGNGKGQQEYQLTPQQFAQFADTGKDGQFDRVLAAGGVGGVLKQLVGSQAGPPERRSDADAMKAGQAERSVNMGHDVTLLRSPAYDRMNPEESRRLQDIQPGRKQNEVRVMGGAEDKVYQNGNDITPDRNQENRLELIRAKNEGRPQRDYMGEIDAKDKAKRGQIELEQGHKDNRASQGIGSREKIAADKLMEQAKSREAANGRNAASNSERLLASKMLSGQKLTPQEEAIKDQTIKGMSPQAPRAPQPQQQQAPQQQRSSADQQALLWANANPNDPRAARIKQLHGVQ